uniref:Uncharacterized protein n=1 Tax=Trichogramma kaykai TaxID=54128 RepID=A0ABD2WCU6_9HYME
MACFNGARKYTRRRDRGKKAPCLSDSDDDDDKGEKKGRLLARNYFLKQNVRRFPSDKRSKIQHSTFSLIPENRRVSRIMLEKKSDHKLSSKFMYMHRHTWSMYISKGKSKEKNERLVCCSRVVVMILRRCHLRGRKIDYFHFDVWLLSQLRSLYCSYVLEA